MRIIFTSDGHIASNYPFSNALNPFKDVFFLRGYQAQKQIIDYSINNGNIPIAFNGDMFDSEKIGGVELFAAAAILNKLLHNNVPTYFNIGNHEIDYEGTIPNIISVLGSMYDNVKAATNKTKWTVFQYGALNMYFIPSVKDKIFNDIITELCSTEIKQPAALFIHQNIKNIQLGKTKMKVGFSESEFMDKIKGRFNCVVCGHLHHPYISEKFGVPLFVTGSTSAVDFRDEGTRKSFLVVDFDKQWNVNSWEQIDIKDQIEFVSIEFDKIDRYQYRTAQNKVFRLYHSTKDNTDEVTEKLMAAGAIAVVKESIPDMISEDGIAAFSRPIQMDTKDWLIEFLKNRIYDEEKAERIVDLHGRMYVDVRR